MAFHAKHHVPHASKMGRVAAPLGKGTLGNGPSGMGSALPPHVPSPSHRHKQSAAPLYGNTAHMKKSAGAGNLHHGQFAKVEGHPLRKPAVHDGIPQPKKLPAAHAHKNITVHCTWSNRQASPVRRTVTQASSAQRSSTQPTATTSTQSAASTKLLYRPPSPPQLATDIQCEAPTDDLRRKLERMYLCATQEPLVFILYICTVIV